MKHFLIDCVNGFLFTFTCSLGLFFILTMWHGEEIPQNTRSIEAFAIDENTLEDEAGNLWGYDDLENGAHYLVWFDDMGTDAVEDDEIVKVQLLSK